MTSCQPAQHGGFVEPGARAAKPRRKIKTAPAAISSRFLCPRPPLLLSAPNQNRHATQANQLPDNCVSRFKGAWWYNGCHYSNLNGLYRPGKIDDTVICWYCWKKACHSAKRSEMTVRPKSFLDILVLRVSGRFLNCTSEGEVDMLYTTVQKLSHKCVGKRHFHASLVKL